MFRKAGNFFSKLFALKKKEKPGQNPEEKQQNVANKVIPPAAVLKPVVHFHWKGQKRLDNAPMYPLSSYAGQYVGSIKTMVDHLSGPQFNPKNPEQLDTYLKNIRVHFKDSASDCVVLFAQLRDPPAISGNLDSQDWNELQSVSLKVSFPSINFYANNLVVERQIMGHVFRDLIANQHTPNVIGFYRDLFVPHRLTLGGKENTQVVPILNRFCVPTGQMERKTLQEVYDREVGNLLNPPRCQIEQEPPAIETDAQCHVLMMEYVSTGTLGELFEAMGSTPLPQLSESDFIGLFVQVYHVLACFARKGMRHNDLHLENLFVKVLHEPEELRYSYPLINDDGLESSELVTRVVKTRFLVKIYDMDRGTIYDQVNRNMLDDTTYCLLVGECNLPSTKFDVAGFNMSALRLLFSIMHDVASQNPHLENGVNRMIQLIRDRLIGTNNWNRFRATKYAQLWLREIEYPRIDAAALSSVHTPIECLNALDEVFPQPIQNRENDEIVEFRLPVQETLHLGHPRKEYLGLDYYQGINACPQPSVMSSATINGTPVKTLFANYLSEVITNGTRFGNIWGKMIQIWSYELDSDVSNYAPTYQQIVAGETSPVASWTDSAATLWVAYTRRNQGRSYTSAPALLAFLSLTCPMYYGMETSVRHEFLNNWSALSQKQKAIDSNSWKTVLSYELSIWDTLGPSLPINIFQLYTRHPLSATASSVMPSVTGSGGMKKKKKPKQAPSPSTRTMFYVE